MRYYHYGNKNSMFTEGRELKASGNIYAAKDRQGESYNSRLPKDSTLVIEDDTVYEIDEECLRCRK